MSRDQVQVYAVVRVDHDFVRTGTPANAVTVKEILPTLEEAAVEVARLNELSADKQCCYFVQATRWFPEGRSVTP